MNADHTAHSTGARSQQGSRKCLLKEGGEAALAMNGQDSVRAGWAVGEDLGRMRGAPAAVGI